MTAGPAPGAVLKVETGVKSQGQADAPQNPTPALLRPRFVSAWGCWASPLCLACFLQNGDRKTCAKGQLKKLGEADEALTGTGYPLAAGKLT